MGPKEILRTGNWLTRERMRLVALAMLAGLLLASAYLIVTANGYVDALGRPLGTDFSNIYAAGTYALEGRPDAPFNVTLQHLREQQIFGARTPAYGWHYPPFFLFVAAALALMPYGPALALWQGLTFIFYLPSIGRILALSPSGPDRDQTAQDRLWLLLATGFPAVFVNLSHGHNGFLTAALIGFGLILLDRRPVAAGMLFGLLAYKPQFGMMIPLVLAATGRWRSFAAAAATVALLVLAATLAFGPSIWAAFFDSARFVRVVALEGGDIGWYKIQSVFSWARMWGGSVAVAYALQSVVTIAVALALTWLWRSEASFALKAAALCLAAMLATPYSLDYDMMILAPAIAFLAADGLARGFGPWEKTALAALWLMPIVTRAVALATLVPLGVLTMIAVFIAILHRAAANLPERPPALWAAAP
jgi:Glycosyltransferase family 87